MADFNQADIALCQAGMLTGDLKAIREDQIDLSQFPPAPALTGVPEHLFVAALPESRLSRLGRLVSSVTVSTIFHALLVIGFIILWKTMAVDLTSSEPISVEVVKSIPGETTKAEPKPDQKPEPKPDALPPPPQSGLAPPPDTKADPATKDEGPAASPVPDQKKPALVEPPPEPQRAATQAQKNDKANLSDDHPKDPVPPPPVKPPEAPQVLTAPQADTSVPQASTAPDPPKPTPPPSETEQRSAADPTAQMTAALPMDMTGLPSTFRAMLSSPGQAASQEYKGVVFGMIGRLQGVAAAARQHGMSQGFMILSITVADSGAIDKVSVIQSSGKPAVDASIADLIRRQPALAPPPPGAQRTYTPSIAFGEE
jgi:periplasmic protein TonB